MRSESVLIEERKLRLMLFLYFCIVMIYAASFQRFGWSNDYVGYKMIFTFEYGNSRSSTEPFFSLLRYINDLFFNSAILPVYVFTSFFSFVLKWHSFRRIAGHPVYFLFICHTMCFFWILEYTQIRASCAIAIFLSSIPDLENKDSKRYLIKALIATLFHYSAFFMFILFLYIKFLKSKKWYVLFPLAGFLFSILCSNFLGNKLRNILYLLEVASGLNKSGNVSNFMSPFNYKYLMLLFSFCVNAVVTPPTDSKNMLLMKIMSFGLCFYYWLNPVGLPVISVRLAEFFTSVFVLYFFLNIRNFPIKEKIICKTYALSVVALYSAASIKVGIL